MMDEAELKKFAQKKLRSGYPVGELKNDLLNEGYAEQEIDKLFLDISSKESVPNEKRSIPQKELHILSLLGVSLIITGIALMGTRIWLTEYTSYIIVIGVLSLGAGFYISYNRKGDNGSS